MIPDAVFSREWALLCERFGKDPSKEMAARYYQFLDRELNERQFLRAVDEVFYGSRFFPTPKEIVEAGRGTDAAQRAEREWSKVLTMRGHQSRKEKTPDTDRPSPAALRALRQVGGMEALRDARPVQIRRFREAFLQAYEALSTETDAPPALPEGREVEVLPIDREGDT